MQPKEITSTSNATIKDAAKLKRKRNRYESRRFLAEGEDLLDAALSRGVIPRQVFVLEGYESLVLGEEAAARLAQRPKPQTPAPEIYICGAAVMDKLSDLGSGSRIIASFDLPDPKFPAAMDKAISAGAAGTSNGVDAAGAGDQNMPATAGTSDQIGPVLYLAGTGDPGNVGTLLRSASALGASAVVLGPGTADPYSPKSLRATMGAIFQVPVYLTVNPEAIVSWAESAGVYIISTDAHSGEPVWKAALEGIFVLVMGSEREGIPHRLTEAAAETVHIPQQGEAESINVAMAGTVIMYEALRQRSPGRG